MRESGSGLRHCFEKALERVGRSLELGNNEAIKEAVQRGVGVAVLSVSAVHKELAAGRLHALHMKDMRCDRDRYVVQDRRRVLPPGPTVPDLPRNESRPRARALSGARCIKTREIRLSWTGA